MQPYRRRHGLQICLQSIQHIHRHRRNALVCKLSPCYSEGRSCGRNRLKTELTGINLCDIRHRLNSGNPRDHVSVNAADSSSDEIHKRDTPTLSTAQPTQQWRSWVRRLSNSHSSQTTPGIHQTPTRDLEIHNIHLQLFFCSPVKKNEFRVATLHDLYFF